MLALHSTMGLLGFCIVSLLPALVLLIDPNVVVWNEVGGRFLSGSHLQMPGFRAVGLNSPFPFQLWNMIDIRSRFDLKLMNSSWSGPAETNIYHKGDSVYLQASALAGADQELYIQSCYATSSPNSMDKSRAALIFNKGCVSSKHLMIAFVSKEQGSINLLLDTSRLKFSQVYIHCSMVFSSALTPDTKSCNYNRNKSIWIELGGATGVCECCASKCKGLFYGGLNKLNTLVSTGPLFIKEKWHEEEPLSYSTNGSSPEKNPNVSVMFPSSIQKSLIVASATVSGNGKKVPYNSPWLSQPVMSDGMMVPGGDPGSALLSLLTGHLADAATQPVLKIVIDIPEEINTSELFWVPSRDGVPVEKVHSKNTSKVTHEAHDLTSLTPELLGEVHTSGLNWDLGDVTNLAGFPTLEEELRGDMFISYKWPQHNHHHVPSDKVHKDAAMSPVVEKPSEKLQENNKMMVHEQVEEVVKKVKRGDVGKLEYIRRSKFMFNQALNGSSSLIYEEEERSPSVGEQEVTKNKMELEWERVAEQGSKNQLMWSLLNLVWGLNETMTDQ